MAVATRTVAFPRARVFAALVDPTTFPEWLVGCKEMRSIDPGWPAPGTRFHHRVGLGGPLAVDDSTRSLAVDEPASLSLEVRLRPIGRGRVTFTLDVEADGSTTVHMDEVPIGAVAPLRPVVAPLTVTRNGRSLERLEAHLAR